MKRSRNVRLSRFRKQLPAATTLAVSVSLVLSGCAPAPKQEEAQIYRNAEECKQVYPDQPALCDQVFGSAQVDHLATAPRFDGLAQCEADFGVGNCEPAPENTQAFNNPDAAAASEPGQQYASGGGGWFMPMMMGYMMGSMMGNRAPRQAPVYSSSAPNSPIRDKLVTGKGDVVGNRGDRTVRAAPSAFQKASAPTRVTRAGGFGTMAAQKAQASSRATNTRSTSRSFGG
ncbi:DUF1190 domain-containing protein [Ferrimonas marina]|uniref:Uncharacterized conserved protein YgiB, involved in bioifilm formation, UPF0441/DUF1190 family n=1 Tax=Ferrimonas marina TaxID=299255 RepID=A0A1M5Z665_9GAMM|nr:DUF1190 domain-containing protein [Ferrimonas marina]SHI19681.1 Uncharacterized conserved protein YgiB, involved in bioifilm formation, UPF0441/DUF1190 family [Ferrimonas marina]